jgi:hypothetical protein
MVGALFEDDAILEDTDWPQVFGSKGTQDIKDVLFELRLARPKHLLLVIGEA